MKSQDLRDEPDVCQYLLYFISPNLGPCRVTTLPTKSIRELATFGFCFLPATDSVRKIANNLDDIGSIEELPGLRRIQILKPNSLDASEPNSYSGNFGLSEFPLHTDLAHWPIPPRYLALQCVLGSNKITTRLLDSEDISKAVGASKLERTLARPRRPLAGEFPLLTLRSRGSVDTSTLFRWDSIFIKPASSWSRGVFQEVVDAIKGVQAQEVILKNPGDLLVVDVVGRITPRVPFQSDPRGARSFVPV